MKSLKWYATYLEIISLQKPKSHFSHSLRSLKSAKSEPWLLRKAQTWGEMITHSLLCHVFFFIPNSNAHSSVSHSNVPVFSIEPACFSHTRLAAHTNVECSRWKKHTRPQWSFSKPPNKRRICTINDIRFQKTNIWAEHATSRCTPPSAASGIWMNKQEKFAIVHPAFDLTYLWIYPGLVRCSDPSWWLLKSPPRLIIQQHINA